LFFIVVIITGKFDKFDNDNNNNIDKNEDSQKRKTSKIVPIIYKKKQITLKIMGNLTFNFASNRNGKRKRPSTKVQDLLDRITLIT
jgi:hypothetical protein